MRTLITGVYGFLGYSLAVKLLERGEQVVGIDRLKDAKSEKGPRVQNLAKYRGFHFEECDISNFDALRMLFRKDKPDRVMHFAAQYAMPHSTELMQRYLSSNFVGFMNMIEACRLSEISRFNYASSTFVEDHVLSTSMYGASKKFNEDAAHIYSSQFGMETVGIRYGSTFGKYCRSDVGVYKTAKRVFSGEEFPIQGGYTYKTAFLWSDDAVRITLDLMDKPLPKLHNTFTLVMDDERYSLFDIMKMMEQHTGLTANYTGKYVDPGPGGVPEKQLQQLEAAIGYRPPTKMKEAVVKFCDWFKGRYEAGKA
jgi:UDP-glucuronate 4-epimerase